MFWKLHSVTHKSTFPSEFVSAEAAIRYALRCGWHREEFVILPVSGNAWRDYQARVEFCVRR